MEQKQQKQQKMKQKQFTQCANSYICRLREENRYSTAHVYENAVNSLIRFAGNKRITFKFFSRDNLKKLEIFLKAGKCQPNTISTYMRALRSLYNKCVEDGYAVYIPQLFRDVFTGIESIKKKALAVKDLKVLLKKPTSSERLQKIQAAINVMFQFCGMPFVDLAHLEKENIKDETLEYHRKKSGSPIKIEVLPTAKEAIAQIETKNDTRYLFPFLSGIKKGKEAFGEYRTALSRFNRDLSLLAKELGLKEHITSYSIRHSFATSLKNQKVPIEMISELLGHKSIKTTQIYLKSFAIEEHTKINTLNYQYVCNYGLNYECEKAFAVTL